MVCAVLINQNNHKDLRSGIRKSMPVSGWQNTPHSLSLVKKIELQWIAWPATVTAIRCYWHFI